MKLGRLIAVARKEVIQIRRDPRSLAMAFLVPAAMIVFFGYIISFDVKDIKIAVTDQDRTEASRELVRAFEAAGRFRVTARPERTSDIAPLLDRAPRSSRSSSAPERATTPAIVSTRARRAR